ncbi:hypothetical protein SAMN02745164_00084 [Marinitoga hydrogenitolerans DSM 16785]|uniref:DUF4129 domain-containing protein n=1 Tax=Marinitoga hydrogenitolerans (strain DSM 16785 / JCM 12826 / AT1271) TaxID=1122195 RepID=A0A1M4S6J6_MARH1|nr:hypothetical protein [Marinitoga hydrogenitolerans]SHE27811.1 hypothetical protein SAMN02745164_00084 [Marinitoga hydrogenitolerans DSM 16785]
MKKQGLIYLFSIFLTFIPFNLNTGIPLLIMGILFSFIYIKIRKFGMPYYIAFLALFGIFMITFFILNAFGSMNLYYSLNIIAISILSYYLPQESKEIIKYTFIFLILIILLRHLINPIFPLITLLISLFELLKEQKNKKIIIAMYAIFIIFSLLNFNVYYNPFKDFHFSPDTSLLKEKQFENSELNNYLNEQNEKQVVQKKKEEILKDITVEEKNIIKKNNNIVDAIILINVIIGGILAIVTAFITWRYLTKNEKRKVIISTIVFFTIIVLLGTGIVYLERGRELMVDKEINSIDSSNQLSNRNAISSEQQMNIFREIASSPRTAYLKLYQEIKWIYLISTILFGILLLFIIIKFLNKQEKEEKFVKEFSIEKYEEENIPDLIDVGYKYIRKRFFKPLSHLTPYELLYKTDSSKEFELLTNLFVLKEYGEKNFDYTKEDIKKIIAKCIDYLKKNSKKA